MREPKAGEQWLFEYHCWESAKSADAALWYHSHQKVTVLAIAEAGLGETMKERARNGAPRVFTVQFADGHSGDAFEDELMLCRSSYCRSDPPRR